MTKVGQKKVDKTEAVTSAATGPELTTAATLGSEFKMSGASVTKHLENAKVPVASTMVSGKRNFVFYDKAKATAAIKAQIAEKARIEAEKAQAKEAAKQRATEKSESKPAEQTAGAVPGDVSRIAANVGALQDLVMLHQDIATKQFDLLNMKADRLEKKQVNLDKDVLAAAVKTAMGDGLATVTSAIRRQREDVDKEFNAQRLAVEAQFVKVTSQLDNLLQRVSALTDVVGALENTILAIHTAPEPQAPITESNKSGEANQEQHFFQSSQGDKPEVPKDQNSSHKDADVVPAGSGKARRQLEQVLRDGQFGKGTDAISGDYQKSPSDEKAVTDAGPKPRVLILGLHDNKVRHIASFKSKLDMTIFNPDEATTRMGKTPPKADYIIQMIDYISHTVSNKVDAGLESILISGGLSTLRRELNKIVKKHQPA